MNNKKKPYKDLGGQRFGRLVAISPIRAANEKGYEWACQCDCGNISNVRIDRLTSGKTKSCGCLNKGPRSSIVFRMKPKEKILKKLPKILLFDIETSPMEVYTWALKVGGGYIPPQNVIKDWAILSWSAKWLFDSKIYSRVVSPKDARNRIDKDILQDIWNLLNKADIVVAHYGNVFDIRKLNTRFLTNGLPPPSPYQTIDTVKETKKTFAISSYKMEYLNGLFKLSQKLPTSFDLWRRCVTGNQAALNEMEQYNRNDVTALEELYLHIRPWIKSHPNTNLYVNSKQEGCPNCGNSKLTWRGYYYTPAGKYAAFRCNACGAIGRSRFSSLSQQQRAKLTLSVAR